MPVSGQRRKPRLNGEPTDGEICPPHAIARAKACEKAGVDALFMVGICSRGELEALRAEMKLPVILAKGGSV
jgi:2-methylisocitrate lyase-like PEP mutase family enzyme